MPEAVCMRIWDVGCCVQQHVHAAVLLFRAAMEGQSVVGPYSLVVGGCRSPAAVLSVSIAAYVCVWVRGWHGWVCVRVRVSVCCCNPSTAVPTVPLLCRYTDVSHIDESKRLNAAVVYICCCQVMIDIA